MLLVLLPFTFIQFFFMPWVAAQEAALVPRSLPPKTHGHVLLTRVGAVEEALVKLLAAAGIEAYVIVATWPRLHPCSTPTTACLSGRSTIPRPTGPPAWSEPCSWPPPAATRPIPM